MVGILAKKKKNGSRAKNFPVKIMFVFASSDRTRRLVDQRRREEIEAMARAQNSIPSQRVGRYSVVNAAGVAPSIPVVTLRFPIFRPALTADAARTSVGGLHVRTSFTKRELDIMPAVPPAPRRQEMALSGEVTYVPRGKRRREEEVAEQVADEAEPTEEQGEEQVTGEAEPTEEQGADEAGSKGLLPIDKVLEEDEENGNQKRELEPAADVSVAAPESGEQDREVKPTEMHPRPDIEIQVELPSEPRVLLAAATYAPNATYNSMQPGSQVSASSEKKPKPKKPRSSNVKK